MALEDEIKQQNFRSPIQKAYLNILFTGNWIMSRQLEIFKPFGISPQQYNVLRILKGQHPSPVRINTITDRMLDQNSNTSRLVDKLVAKGFVDRFVCPEDRRAVDVTITDMGIQLLEQISPKIIKFEEEGCQLISEEEARQLSILLEKIRNSKSLNTIQ